jgi:hypothetical protein
MINCSAALTSHMDFLSSQYSCEPQGDGWISIVSPYTFPDGDLVEIELREIGSEIRLSDRGETLRHLATIDFDPRSGIASTNLLMDILKQHRVELVHGTLQKQVATEAVGEATHELLMACFAVGQLIYLSRGYTPRTFQEEVAEALTEYRVRFETGHKETGTSGKVYPIDFRFIGEKREGLMQTLSPARPEGMTIRVNSTFRMWSEIPNHRWRSSLIDDRYLSWRDTDLTSLRNVSDVYLWSERDDESGLTGVLSEFN